MKLEVFTTYTIYGTGTARFPERENELIGTLVKEEDVYVFQPAVDFLTEAELKDIAKELKRLNKNLE